MNTTLDLTNKAVQRAVRNLEQLDFFPAIDKAHLLLVANGNKPSMHSGFFSEPSIAIQNVLPSDIAKRNLFIDIVTDLGLMYRVETKLFDYEIDGVLSYSTRIVLCVAKDMNVVNQLFTAREQGDDKTEGILLGFPDSAVHAYVSNNLLDMASHPIATKLIDADDMKLLNHRLSKDNWEEEVLYLADYARAIKILSAEIYGQCIAE
jgi:hypothetical protein